MTDDQGTRVSGDEEKGTEQRVSALRVLQLGKAFSIFMALFVKSLLAVRLALCCLFFFHGLPCNDL